MNRRQLAHILRAAADVGSDPHILVIGSQAILASFDDDALPGTATRSIEADVAFFNDEDHLKADFVEGAIGEDSMFHQSFGYYGQGVSVTTATLPDGWQDRLVSFTPPDSAPAEALCLDPSDLAVAKLVAGRQKDIEYVVSLLASGHLQPDVLRERVASLSVVGAVRSRVSILLERLVAKDAM